MLWLPPEPLPEPEPEPEPLPEPEPEPLAEPPPPDGGGVTPPLGSVGNVGIVIPPGAIRCSSFSMPRFTNFIVHLSFLVTYYHIRNTPVLQDLQHTHAAKLIAASLLAAGGENRRVKP